MKLMKKLFIVVAVSFLAHFAFAGVEYGEIFGVPSDTVKESEKSAESAVESLGEEKRYGWIVALKRTTKNVNGKLVTSIIYKAGTPEVNNTPILEQLKQQQEMEQRLGVRQGKQIVTEQNKEAIQMLIDMFLQDQAL